jgi:hypothetical protein
MDAKPTYEEVATSIRLEFVNTTPSGWNYPLDLSSVSDGRFIAYLDCFRMLRLRARIVRSLGPVGFPGSRARTGHPLELGSANLPLSVTSPSANGNRGDPDSDQGEGSRLRGV